MDLDPDQLERLNASPLPRLVAIAGGLLSNGWRRVLEQHGLATSGLVLLFTLSGENELTHREAARRCWVSAGTLTGVVDALEEEGLVTRHPDRSDRRIVRLALTPAGKERVSAGGGVVPRVRSGRRRPDRRRGGRRTAVSRRPDHHSRERRAQQRRSAPLPHHCGGIVTTELAPVIDHTTTVPAVEVTELVKRYPKATANAVDGVSFTVMPGEIFGLLGPNGAGKTTTVGVLTTRVRLTSGSARVSGIDVSRDPVGARRRLAVVPQRNEPRPVGLRSGRTCSSMPPTTARRPATAGRGRRIAGGVRPVRARERPAGAVLRRPGAAGDDRPGPDARPGVLFLDEPSTGLDPAARLFV